MWIIGGHHGKLYTDNSKIFHQYILNNHPEINIYWVIDKHTTVAVEKKIPGKKIILGSIKGYLYFFQAEVTLFSDTLNSDIAPYSFILPFVRKLYHRTFKVYLSHGTIAFKKMPSYIGKIAQLKKSIFQSYNLAIASTELAKKAMINYGIRSENVYILGSARNDMLQIRHSEEKIILVAPTWRIGVSSLSSFEKSDFFTEYYALLTDKYLQRYLTEQGYTIHFYLHHMFHKYLHLFQELENDSIKILVPHSDIGNEIMSAKLMITDYSSMCADFYYLQKPVLFFQFDKQRFISEVGSEINLNNDIFGDVFEDKNRLVQNIIHSIDKHLILSDKQKQGEKYFVHFTDKKNCERIYYTIQQHLKKEIL